jgi:hypothetical protein
MIIQTKAHYLRKAQRKRNNKKTTQSLFSLTLRLFPLPAGAESSLSALASSSSELWALRLPFAGATACINKELTGVKFDAQLISANPESTNDKKKSVTTYHNAYLWRWYRCRRRTTFSAHVLQSLHVDLSCQQVRSSENLFLPVSLHCGNQESLFIILNNLHKLSLQKMVCEYLIVGVLESKQLSLFGIADTNKNLGKS